MPWTISRRALVQNKNNFNTKKMKPVELHIIMRNQTRQGLSEINNDLTGVDKAVNTVSTNFKARMNEQRAVIKQVEKDIKSLRKEWEEATPGIVKNNMALDIRAANKALQEEIQILEDLKVQAKETGVAFNSMGGQMKHNNDTAVVSQKRFNGLNMSLQQVARELPTLAMGPQMFFLAISNNLPILADNIKLARNEYDMLVASGQKATPVWKQLVKSLFSWQTAMVAGITLLVVYGKELVNWTKQLFTGKKALSETYNTLQEFHQAVAETSKKNLTEFEKLSKSWDRLGDNLKAKEKFILENKEAFRQLGVSISDVNEAENIFNNNKDVFIESLMARAKAAAAFNLAAKEFQKGIEQDVKADAMPDKKEWSYFQKNTYGGNPEKEEARKKAEEYYTSGRAMVEKMLGYSAEEQELLKSGNIKSINTIVEGSVAAIETAIATKQEALKRVTSRKDYDKIEAEIRAEQEKLRAITGNLKYVDQFKTGQEMTDSYNKIRELMTANELSNLQSRIDLMNESSDKVLAQIQLDYEKRFSEIKKQEGDFLKKLQEEERKTWEKKNPDYQKRNLQFTPTITALTPEQRKQFDEMYSLAYQQREKKEIELYKAQADSMRAYLKEYGTFQQRKLAIAQEYAEKIKKVEESGNNAEVMRLKKQQQSAVEAVEISSIKADIDWQSVFGNFGDMLESQLKPMLENLKKYANSDEFKGASLQDRQIIYDVINRLEKQTSGGLSKKMFSDLAHEIKLYQNSFRSLIEAKEREKEASEQLAKAQEKLKKAQTGGDKNQIASLQETVDNAQQAFDQAGESVKALTEVNNVNAENLGTSSSKTIDTLNNLGDGLNRLSSKSLGEALKGVGQVGQTIGGKVGDSLAKAFSGKGIVGEIIAAVIGILDILKEGIGTIISGLIDSILAAVDGILDNILSGKLFEQIGVSLFKGVRNILDTVTFGVFNSNGNAKEVNALIDELTHSNKYLITAIEKLTAKMEKSGGANATEYYESALEKQRQKVENDRQMLEAKMGYTNSHHSNNHYINKAFNADDWKKASDYVGTTLKSAGDLWKLSPEDLAKLQELPDIWDKIHSGKYDQSEWLDEYINDAETLLELTQQWQDVITDTSFDNIRSGMKNLLADFKVDSKEAIASVDEFLKNAILNSIVSGTYSDLIAEWQSLFAEAMKDGILSASEADFLRDRYQSIFDQALADRDAAFTAAGIKDTDEYNQSGRAGGFTTMSQDTGNKLEGLFTSVQMHVSNIDDRVMDIAQVMYQALEGMGELIDNTSYCRLLEQINERVERIERDGLKIA